MKSSGDLVQMMQRIALPHSCRPFVAHQQKTTCRTQVTLLIQSPIKMQAKNSSCSSNHLLLRITACQRLMQCRSVAELSICLSKEMPLFQTAPRGDLLYCSLHWPQEPWQVWQLMLVHMRSTMSSNLRIDVHASCTMMQASRGCHAQYHSQLSAAHGVNLDTLGTGSPDTASERRRHGHPVGAKSSHCLQGQGQRRRAWCRTSQQALCGRSWAPQTPSSC